MIQLKLFLFFNKSHHIEINKLIIQIYKNSILLIQFLEHFDFISKN